MRHRLIDLKALQTFVAVVEAGSLTAAARRLSYSQSTVTMQLQRLETDLGVCLLQREHGHVRITPAGEITLTEAREMLARNGALRTRLASDVVGGRIRFGMPADLAPLLHETWACFARRYPQVEIQVVSELSAVLCRRLDDGQLDLAILTLPAGQPRGDLLRRESLIWIGAETHEIPDVSRLPLAIGPDGACAFRSAATAALDAAGRHWRIAYEGQTFAALASQVTLGLAVTAAVPSMLGPGMRRLDPAVCDLPTLPQVDLRLAWRDGPATPATRRLAGLIEQASAASP